VSDEAGLVQRCLLGQPDAIRLLVERFQAEVYGLCVRLLHHRHDAEDVSQEVFLRVFRSLHRWDAARPLKPWVMGIAVNRCRTWMGQRARRPEAVDHLQDLVPAPALDDAAELLREIQAALGDLRPEYLLEQFVPGDVYHVDSLVFDRRVVFAAASRYGTPPMAVAHEGGIFVTRTLSDEDATTQRLKAINERVLESFGLLRGVSHTEFIRARDGELYFLETSARVGGAYIVDVVEAATGINLWREWAKIEIAGEYGTYVVPKSRGAYAGIVLSLARQEQPDTSGYTDSEIVTRVEKRHHAGLIVAAPDEQRVRDLVESYAARFYRDFHASAPAPERAAD